MRALRATVRVRSQVQSRPRHGHIPHRRRCGALCELRQNWVPTVAGYRNATRKVVDSSHLVDEPDEADKEQRCNDDARCCRLPVPHRNKSCATGTPQHRSVDSVPEVSRPRLYQTLLPQSGHIGVRAAAAQSKYALWTHLCAPFLRMSATYCCAKRPGQPGRCWRWGTGSTPLGCDASDSLSRFILREANSRACCGRGAAAVLACYTSRNQTPAEVLLQGRSSRLRLVPETG